MVKHFLFALAILSFCRLLWFIPNQFWLGDYGFLTYVSTFLQGVYFDLPVVAYFFIPTWILHLLIPIKPHKLTQIHKILFTISASICLILNTIDAGYSQITTRRSGFELLYSLGDESNHIIPYIKDYWYAVLMLLCLIWLVYRYCPVQGYSLYIYRGMKALHYIWLLPLTFGLWLLSARGGVQLKPLRTIDAGNYVQPELIPLVTSTPMQFMSSFGQQEMPAFAFMPNSIAEKIVLGKSKPVSQVPIKKNVVFIIVESLGRDYTGFLNKQPFTPFLDSLSKSSISFPFCYANGYRSIEMVPSIFCGLTGITPTHYINSLYSNNAMKNAFSVFEKSGYTTGFFHGAANGTMGFQSFLGSTGLSKYYGLNEYPSVKKDYDGHWGIPDHLYLQYYLHYLDTVRKPNFSTVFTLSSHHPYVVPEKFAQTLPEGKLPIHKSIAYADLSLRMFFQEASKKDWYKNTLFVITGDHTSHGTEDYFYSQTGHFEIPLLFFSPNTQPVEENKTVSQCDILPTVIDMLHLRGDWFTLGRSAFDSAYAGYSVHMDNGIYYVVQYPYLLALDVSGRIKEFSARYRNEPLAKNLNPVGNIKAAEMELYLKAYLQVFSSRLRNNKWR